jgi:hypothetical protein
MTGSRKFTKRVSGEKAIVTWLDLEAGEPGVAYEVVEGGPALAIVDGDVSPSGTVMLYGSNDGQRFHLLAGKIRPGAIQIPAVPAFIRPEAHGNDTKVTVSVTFSSNT